MANDSWSQVLGVLTAQGRAPAGPSLGEQLAALTAQLQAASQAHSQNVQANTKAVTQATTTAATTGSSAAGIGHAVVDFLGAGTGLSPLLKGLFSLFGGGGGSSGTTPAPLPVYLAPPAVSFEGLYDSGAGSVMESSTGQGGQVRALNSRGAMAAPQITVNVQAMDSQSFLNRSDDIARAVRLAMLQSNVLSDVVREL